MFMEEINIVGCEAVQIQGERRVYNAFRIRFEHHGDLRIGISAKPHALGKAKANLSPAQSDEYECKVEFAAPAPKIPPQEVVRYNRIASVALIDAEDVRRYEEMNLIPRDLPVAQVAIYFQIANNLGFNPMMNEIVIIPFGKEPNRTYSIHVGINGLKKKAAQTGQLAGIEYRYDGLSLAEWNKWAKSQEKPPKYPDIFEAIVSRVLPNGTIAVFSNEIDFDEYAQRWPDGNLKSTWKDKPKVMGKKCALAGAFRDGFSDVIGSLYIPEEMDGPEAENIRKEQAADTAAIDKIIAAESMDELVEIGIQFEHLRTDSLFQAAFAKKKAELEKPTEDEPEVEEV